MKWLEQYRSRAKNVQANVIRCAGEFQFDWNKICLFDNSMVPALDQTTTRKATLRQEVLHADTQLRREFGDDLRFDVQKGRVRNRVFEHDTEVRSYRGDALHVQPPSQLPRHTDVLFEALRGRAELFAPDNIRLRRIEIPKFVARDNRFPFHFTRKESPLGFGAKSTGQAKAIKHRIPRVETLPPPDAAKDADLKDRLLWILSPPIHELLSDPELALPETPFPYQIQGIKWLMDRDGALLADEMGLGKTMQAILAARLLLRAGRIKRILVVCPKPLMMNWKEEFEKWWPQIRGYISVYSTGLNRERFISTTMPTIVVKIINYDALLRVDDSCLMTQGADHDLVIIDEAQRIKNPESRTSVAVKLLKSKRRWALTGTPLENRIEDLISICGFVHPKLVANFETSKIKPYMLRRRADDVLTQLPEKIEQDIEIELTNGQRQTYDRAEREGVVELNSRGDSITVFHVFQLIAKLKQLCNFDPVTGESAKLDYLLDDMEEVVDSGRKALVFSQFVSEEFGLKCIAKRFPARYRATQLHGEVADGERLAVLRSFENDENVKALLLNYKVGGVGLNLQAANYVYLFDRWWNPAVEDQAVKRVHRLGQKRTVFVRRFICRNTFEERIMRILDEKRALFRAVIDDTKPAENMGLTQDELFSVFDLKAPSRRQATTTGVPRIVLENINPKQFEEMIGELYRNLSYQVQVTGGSRDFGIDVFAERNTASGTERLAIQCKHQIARVGRPILQALWGVVNHDQRFTQGVLVTSGDFSTDAIEFAVGKRMTLIDGRTLKQLLRSNGVADCVASPAR